MEMRSLYVYLTDEDFKMRADKLANHVKERTDIEEHKRSVNAKIKEELDEVVAKINTLAAVVKEKREMRPVECSWFESWPDYMMKLLRNDTGEEVDSRPMTAGERQIRLFPVAGKKGKKAAEVEEPKTAEAAE